jgi:TatD DNase family protein
MSLALIDTHIHLSAPEFDPDLDLVIKRASLQGVAELISIGSGYGQIGIEKTIQIAANYPNVFMALGIHPNEAHNQYSISELKPLLSHPKCLAVGETGLDYFRDHCPAAIQIERFIEQISLAKEIKKPIIIHNRNAGKDCLTTLKQHSAEQVGGVFHCYSEDAEYALELSKLNFLISLTGNLTYKNNSALREAVKLIPIEQIMLETDAPYLSPQSCRGKRNESSLMLETAKMLAEIKQLPLETVAEITTSNAKKLFKLP